MNFVRLISYLQENDSYGYEYGAWIGAHIYKAITLIAFLMVLYAVFCVRKDALKIRITTVVLIACNLCLTAVVVPICESPYMGSWVSISHYWLALDMQTVCILYCLLVRCSTFTNIWIRTWLLAGTVVNVAGGAIYQYVCFTHQCQEFLLAHRIRVLGGQMDTIEMICLSATVVCMMVMIGTGFTWICVQWRGVLRNNYRKY